MDQTEIGSVARAPLTRVVLAALLTVSGADLFAQQTAPSFTTEQAVRGASVYGEQCASCHGENLSDGAYGPPLKGPGFLQRWGGKPLDELFILMASTMPTAAPRSLTDQAYADLLAHILLNNGVAPGPDEVRPDPVPLAKAVLPTTGPTPSGGIAGGVALPPPPDVPANPLDRITPVTADMLANPPDGDWLTWRRSSAGTGYSPLDQITRENVDDLRVVWSWALPEGPAHVAPLVHDGVIFAHGWGDIVQALDAGSGDLLWQYTRWLPDSLDSFAYGKRSIALYGEHVILATSDAHVVALSMKTGEVVWDQAIGGLQKGHRVTGGPLVAEDRVMIGTSGQVPGGNFIVGLDAATGAEVWRFRTIAQPGTPGGDTWVDLPAAERTGASSWVPGSYDAATGLAYFGTAQTYNTGPLLAAGLDAGAANAGLYTDSTLAIDPATGELAWHFQHLPNDQWDLDWVFERILFSRTVNGIETPVMVSAGKSGIHDLLNAETGGYIASVDPGMQDFIQSIDPESGRRTIDPARLPRADRTVSVCPHADGTKNWMPSAWNPQTRMLYVPLMEICMDMVPVVEGEQANLSSGVRWTGRPRPDADGRYGRLQAINLDTGELTWAHRQRAPRTSGILTTAGRLVFGGDLQRYLTAFDADSGEELWRFRLNDVPVAPPVSFEMNGRQYLAVTVGRGVIATARGSLVPEIRLPMAPAATLWIFALPESGEH
ncbi:PQQ-binding-like beta-propeller repeat protein [Elongatibacter sediminis]|uniref:PQQ-binding-like beta-propeller repeat protein n=1 Tax=Elongatibacter sediminis TaxID=3119006 RepID=A0AAW9RKS6_9GAMM